MLLIKSVSIFIFSFLTDLNFLRCSKQDFIMLGKCLLVCLTLCNINFVPIPLCIFMITIIAISLYLLDGISSHSIAFSLNSYYTDFGIYHSLVCSGYVCFS